MQRLVHRRINPDKALARPAKRADFDAFPVMEHDKLVGLLCACSSDSAQQTLIKRYLKKHIGAQSTYTHKAELKKQLSILAHVLTSSTQSKKFHISTSKKQSYMKTILSDIARCTPGFHDRIQHAVSSLCIPQSVDELLFIQRNILVEEAYNQDEKRTSTRREVHTHNRFYTYANLVGYSVSSNRHDPHSGIKTNQEIQNALRNVFLSKYIPSVLSTELVKTTLLDILSVDMNVKDDVDASRDLACQFLRNVLNDQSIRLYDIFDFDPETYVIGALNWPKVVSRVIEYLESNNYVRPLNLSEHGAVDVTPGLTLYFKLTELSEAFVIYKTVDSDDKPLTIKGYLFAPHEMNIINVLPTNDAISLLHCTTKHFVTNMDWLVLCIKLSERIGQDNPATRDNFNKMLTPWVRQHIQTASELKHYLTKLNTCDHLPFLQMIMPWIPTICNDMQQLPQLISSLKPEVAALIYRALQHHLPSIRTKDDFISHLRINESIYNAGDYLEMMKGWLIDHIKSADDLADYLIELSPGQCRIVCEYIKASIPTILSPGKLATLYNKLSDTQCRTVCAVLGDQLDQILGSKSDIAMFLQNLHPSKYSVAYTSLNKQIKHNIQTITDFCIVLNQLSAVPAKHLCERYSYWLEKVIRTIHEIKCMVRMLRPDVFNIACATVPTKLGEVIGDSNSLGLVLKELDDDTLNFSAIFEILITFMPGVFKTAKEFGECLRHLPATRYQEVFAIIPMRLILKSGRDTGIFLRQLSDEQGAAVCLLLAPRLRENVTYAHDLIGYIKAGKPKQTDVVFHILGDKHIANLITSEIDLSSIIFNLNEKRQTYVVELIKHKLAYIIQSDFSLNRILISCSPALCRVILDKLQNQFANIIKNPYQLVGLLKGLTPEKCRLVCLTSKDTLRHFDGSLRIFMRAISDVPAENFNVVIESYQDQLAGYICSGKGVMDLLRHLDPTQCDVTCKVLRTAIHAALKTSQDVAHAFQNLCGTQRTTLFNTVKDRLPDLVQQANDIPFVLRNLSYSQCMTFLKCLRDKLPTLITSAEVLGETLAKLDDQPSLMLIDQIYDCYGRSPPIMATSKQFGAAVRPLPNATFASTALFLLNIMPQVYRTTNNFSEALQCLSPAQCGLLCTEILNRRTQYFSRILQSSRDFGMLLQRLTPAQCHAVCTALKYRLTSSMKTSQDFRDAYIVTTPLQHVAVYRVLLPRLLGIIKCENITDFEALTGCNFNHGIKSEMILKTLVNFANRDQFTTFANTDPVTCRPYIIKFIWSSCANSDPKALVSSFKKEYAKQKEGAGFFSSNFLTQLPQNPEHALGMITQHMADKPHSRTADVVFNLVQASVNTTCLQQLYSCK